MKKSLLALLLWSNLFGIRTHIIYVSGPPIPDESNSDSSYEFNNDNWFKESKIIYAGIKKKVKLDGNTVELFPKKNYRGNLDKRRKMKHSLSKRELENKYENMDELLKDLTDLIVKRRDEILLKNEIIDEYLDNQNLNTDDDNAYYEKNYWDTHIHLRAHGIGSNLLYLLNNSTYNKLLGTLVTFDGIDYNYSELTYSSEEKKQYNTIINITINKISELSDEYWSPSMNCMESNDCGCTNKKFFATVGAILGVVGGILALL